MPPPAASCPSMTTRSTGLRGSHNSGHSRPSSNTKCIARTRNQLAMVRPRVAATAAKHNEREWNQTRWLSRGKLHDPEELTALKYSWIKSDLPIHVRAMVLTENMLFIAGTPNVIDEVDLWHKPDDPELKRGSWPSKQEPGKGNGEAYSALSPEKLVTFLPAWILISHPSSMA